MTFRSLAGAIAALAALLAQPAARADEPLDIHLSYTVSTDGTLPDITRIVTFNSYANGGTGAWWASMVPGGATTTLIDDPFLKSSANAPLDGLMLGLVQDLAGDPPGQKHMVLLMSSAAADLSANIAWGTLFANTNETELIANLELATSGQDFSIIEPGLNALYAFALGDARTGVLGPGGVATDAWFSLGMVSPGATTTSSFKLVAFSSGQIIGEGIASLQTLSPVPEPEGGVLLMVGLLVVSMAARRRVASSPRPPHSA